MIFSITVDSKEGGIANSLVSYSKGLKLINEEHLVLLPNDAPVIQRLAKLRNVKILALNKKILYFHIYTKFFFHKKLGNKLKACKWIFIHNSKLRKYFNGFHKKVGLINHSGKLRNTVHNACNIFITSQGLKNFLTRYPVNQSKNLVICHGFEELKTQTVDRKQEHKNLNIISAGRFVEKKGFEYLIEAAYLLQENNSTIQIKLYGDGPLKQHFKKKIKALQLQNLILMSWHSSLHTEFLKSDVLCVPSLEEPFGLIIGEAMINELPVISTKTDGALEIFGDCPEDNGGILVDFSSPHQLMNAMLKMEDKQFRNAVSKNAKNNIMTNFSLVKLSSNIKNLIDNEH